jgi:hypothetical protein
MSVYRVLVLKNGKPFRNLRIVKRGGYQRGAREDRWTEREADEGFEEVLLAQLEIEAAPDRNKNVVPLKVPRVRVRGPWAAGGRRKAGV